MVRAKDCATKSPARWVLVWLGLGACVSDIGCARLRSFRQEPPMLGSAAPFGNGTQNGGDFYAQEVGKGTERSRTLLAQERARSEARDRSQANPERLVRSTAHPIAPAGSLRSGADGPLDVALQPPISIPVRRQTPPAAVVAANDSDAAPKAVPPVEPPKDDVAATNLESIVSASRTKLNALASYQVTLKRQERVGETLQPAEEALLSIRRQPKAVRPEWPTGPHKGREVIYTTEGDGLMHVNMADSVIPVPPLALAPDSPLALRNSRHPITEAGFDAILENIEKALKPAPGDTSVGKLSYGGLENPGQLERPCHNIVRVTPSGETWHVYVDPETKFPAMVEATAANGDLLERYVFGEPKVDLPELASSDAFDFNRRWGQSQGLLQRLARAGGTKPGAENATR